jgi:transcription-repair coupling factor (superfamily II helicase)
VAATTGVVIELPIPAYLPENWIPEMALRLQIYRRIAGLTTREAVIEVTEELRDRFGQLPAAVEGLLYQIEVKLLARRINATHIIARDGQIQIRLPYLGEVNRPVLEQSLGENVSVTRTAVSFPFDDELWQLRLLDLLTMMGEGLQAGIGV